MKKLLIIVIGVFIPVIVFAQRYSTASNVNLAAGIVNDGYVAALGYEKFFSSKTSIQLTGNYMSRKQKIKNISTNAELSSYFLDAKYKYYLTDQKIFSRI